MKTESGKIYWLVVDVCSMCVRQNFFPISKADVT